MTYDRPLVGAVTATLDRTDVTRTRAVPASGRDVLAPVAIALTLVPLVVLAVHMLRSDVVLTADLATTEMLTRDLGHRSPSLGPFSRDGWFHPGPALFYVLAPSYRLFGSDGSALGGRCGGRQRGVGGDHGGGGPPPRRNRADAGDPARLRRAHARRRADVPRHAVERLRHRPPLRRSRLPHLGGGRRRALGPARRHVRDVVPDADPRRVRGAGAPPARRRRRVDAGRGDRRPSPAARRAECRGARRRGRRRTRRGRGGARRRRSGARRPVRGGGPPGSAPPGGRPPAGWWGRSWCRWPSPWSCGSLPSSSR